tara:strand:+ start:481 stop:1023 length:543 start_codon:yes stop_codon:yes gene_type:complete
MSTLFVDTINEKTTNNGVEIPGHVINVQSVNFSGTQTSTSSSFTDVTNLSITMTPKSSSSKFFVSCSMAVGCDAHFVYLRLVRNGVALQTPDDTGSNRSTSHFSYATDVIGSSAYIILHLPAQHLDSPNTTSAVTYKVQFATRSDTSMSAHINRTHRNLDNSGGYDANGVSTLTVMEIGG